MYEENQRKKKEIERQKKRKERDTYNKMVQKAKEVLARKPTIGEMTIQELTTVCKPYKTKADGKMPSRKQYLMEAYVIWKQSPPPLFEDELSDDEDVVLAVPVTTNDDNEIVNNENNETVMQVVDV